MKLKHIYIFIISLFSMLSFGQNKDSLQLKNPLPYSLFVGIDLAKPALKLLDKNHEQYEATLDARIYKKWHAATEIGYHKETFEELDWLIHIDGLYYKAGFNYELSSYEKNQNEMIYAGFRFAHSNFNQEIKKYTIRFDDYNLNQVGSFKKEKASASWLEFSLGARTKLFKLPLYAGINGQMKFLVNSSKQNGVDVIIAPSYGKTFDKIKFGLSWTLSYEIPYKKIFKTIKIKREIPKIEE